MARPPKIIGAAQGQNCSYGCGNLAKVEYANGKFCCFESYGQCPAVKRRMSASISESHVKGRSYTYNPASCWNRGLTELTSDSVRRNSDSLRRTIEMRRSSELDERKKWTSYRNLCSWDSAVISDNITRIEGYLLLKELGMYNKHTNPNGVVRDHRFSVRAGYLNDVDPTVITHPANCRFLPHKENARKTHLCEISLDQLQDLIDSW